MLEQFDNQKYINLETFRKSGEGVKTPVWFVQDRDAFYVWTQAASWKAKRIRKNGRVKLVPSKVAGEPLGDWIDAHATVDESEPSLHFTRNLMRQKYGLAFMAFDLMGKLRKSKHTSIRIEFPE